MTQKKVQLAEQQRRKEAAENRDYSKLYSTEAIEEEKRRKEERKLAKLNGYASETDEEEEQHDDGMDSDDSFM